ncbi:nitrate/nitrite transporter [Humibacter sp. RRB41]|uniref:MFS transporter n=1 Tax=Humibacter sp. RRB41 TaxID=2919946 RepID=UPI001FAAA423|nr:MFS transporter [Humibacter sp. RRB41]
MNSVRSWWVFAAGVFGYLIAVMQRTTIGVAGVSATERFHSNASLMSTLAVLQLVVYAGMQIPVGVLIDRVGPRVLMLTGTALMVAGQLLVAFSDVIGVAVGGRVLVGAGDAMIFICLIRLVNSWFSGRIVPQLSQWVGNIGQLGQVLSAVPFAFLLHESGWTVAFASAAGVALVSFVAILAIVHNSPVDAEGEHRSVSWAQSLHQLGVSIARPGTQLGFWSHFVTQSSGTVFAMMWGFPFMVYALGYPAGDASWMLTIIVGAALVVGPVLGILTARFPLRRSNIVLTIVAAMGVVWAVLLLWPGTPPVWLVVLLLVVVGAGGPGSLIGFDFARTTNPLHSLGSANGFVNVGGFAASFVMIYLIGVLLDWRSHLESTALYTIDGFRIAFAVQYIVVGIGVVFLLAARRRTRKRLLDDEGIEVGPLWVALVARWNRGRQ